MKLLLIISLLSSLPLFSAWAQDPVTPPITADTEQGAEDKTNGEVKKKASISRRPPGNVSRPRIPKDENNSMKILANSLPEDAFLWLKTETESFLSIWQEDRSGDSKGALLVIHAEGEHPSWPTITRPLHDTLPDNGWLTLAVSLPLPDPRKIPKRSLPVKTKAKKVSEIEEGEKQQTAKEETNNNSETSAKATKKPAEAKTVKAKDKISAELTTERRLESALQFLHNNGQFNIILLGSGSGAIRAQSFIEKITPKIDDPELKEKLEKPIRALILVNGRNQLPSMHKSYNAWFSDPEIPILDIFFKNDQRNQHAAKKRKILAKKKRVSVYKQVALSDINYEKNWGGNQLSRRILGFLDTHAVGVEIKDAKIIR